MPGEVAPERDEAGRHLQLQPLLPAGAAAARWAARSTTWASCPTGATPPSRRCAAPRGDHDLILTSGGVSVGEEDHVKPAVQALGSLDLWQIAMKPGKPFAYGKVGDAHFIGLPGNPVSSFVTFLLLVRPFLLKLQGATQLAPQADAAARALRLAARRQAPRVPARAAQRRRAALDLFRQPELGRADLHRLGRRPGRQPGRPARSRGATRCASFRWRSCCMKITRASISPRSARRWGAAAKRVETSARDAGALRDELIARGGAYARAWRAARPCAWRWTRS